MENDGFDQARDSYRSKRRYPITPDYGFTKRLAMISLSNFALHGALEKFNLADSVSDNVGDIAVGAALISVTLGASLYSHSKFSYDTISPEERRRSSNEQ